VLLARMFHKPSFTTDGLPASAHGPSVTPRFEILGCANTR